MGDMEERLSRLEKELAEAKDWLAICRQTAAYGPSVDSGDSVAAAALWTEDGAYDWGQGLSADSESAAAGRERLIKVFDGPEHRSILETGAAHWLSQPHVVVRGDRAISLCYSCLFKKTADGIRIVRVSACRFDWRRSPEGWRIERRLNRPLDGTSAARTLLADGLAANDLCQAEG